MRARLRQHQARLGLAAGRMDALSPLAILRRGYAICRDESGTIVRDAAAVHVGQQVGVDLARGGLRCRVEQTLEESARQAAARGPE